MSVEILLLPAALAGFSTMMSIWGGSGTNEQGQRVCVVQTRFKHTGLLVQALTNLGVKDVDLDGEVVTGRWGQNEVTFSRNEEGILACHFEGEIEDNEATERIASLDVEYAALVQQQVRDRVLAQAGKLGMTVESETVDADEGITLVLNVER